MNRKETQCNEIEEFLHVYLELEKTHCKARLYGSIKFALTSDISKNKIKEWFDEFDDNNDLYIGLNPMDY